MLVSKYWACKLRPKQFHSITISSHTRAREFLELAKFPFWTESLSIATYIRIIWLRQDLSTRSWVHSILLHIQGNLFPFLTEIKLGFRNSSSVPTRIPKTVYYDLPRTLPQAAAKLHTIYTATEPQSLCSVEDAIGLTSSVHCSTIELIVSWEDIDLEDMPLRSSRPRFRHQLRGQLNYEISTCAPRELPPPLAWMMFAPASNPLAAPPSIQRSGRILRLPVRTTTVLHNLLDRIINKCVCVKCEFGATAGYVYRKHAISVALKLINLDNIATPRSGGVNGKVP